MIIYAINYHVNLFVFNVIRNGIRRLRGHIRREASLRPPFGLQRLQSLPRRPLLPVDESLQEVGHGEEGRGDPKDETEIQSENSRSPREKMSLFPRGCLYIFTVI